MPKVVIFDFDGPLANSHLVGKMSLSDFHQKEEVQKLIVANTCIGEVNRIVSGLMFEETKVSYTSFIGAGKIVKQLASQYLLAICTNNCRRNIDYVLGEIIHLFSCVKTCEDVNFLKPHPQGICDIMRELEVQNPRDVIMIGDSMSDVEAAKAAGVQFALVTWGEPIPAIKGIPLFNSPDELVLGVSCLLD